MDETPGWLDLSRIVILADTRGGRKLSFLILTRSAGEFRVCKDLQEFMSG